MWEVVQGFVDGCAGALGWPGAVRQIAEGGASRTACSKACSLARQKCQVCAGTREAQETC